MGTAISMGMLDYAARADSRLHGGVVKVFAEESKVLTMAHVIDIGTENTYEYLVEGSLGNPAWRSIGESITASTGLINPAVEHTSILSDMIQIDRQRIGNRDFVASRIDATVRGLALKFDRDFFLGDTATDIKSMKGLKARITGALLTYAVDETGATTNGGYVNKSLAEIRKMIRSVRGLPGDKVLFMTGDMHDLLSQAVAAESQQNYLVVQGADGGVSSLIPSFERVRIVEIEDDHQGNEILAFNETRGTDTTTGSIYCVWMGKTQGQGLNFLAKRGNQGIFDLDPFVQNNTQREAPVEGRVGVVLNHPRTAARAAGFKTTNFGL